MPSPHAVTTPDSGPDQRNVEADEDDVAPTVADSDSDVAPPGHVNIAEVFGACVVYGGMSQENDPNLYPERWDPIAGAMRPRNNRYFT